MAACLVKLGAHEQPAGRLALHVPAIMLSISKGVRMIFPTPSIDTQRPAPKPPWTYPLHDQPAAMWAQVSIQCTGAYIEERLNRVG